MALSFYTQQMLNGAHGGDKASRGALSAGMEPPAAPTPPMGAGGPEMGPTGGMESLPQMPGLPPHSTNLSSAPGLVNRVLKVLQGPAPTTQPPPGPPMGMPPGMPPLQPGLDQPPGPTGPLPAADMMRARGGAIGQFARGGYPELQMGMPMREPFSTGGETNYVGSDASGDGRSDHIEARLSPNEFVMDAETVALLGNGSPDAGAEILERLRQNIREHKGKALVKGKFSPDAKPPEEYMGGE